MYKANLKEGQNQEQANKRIEVAQEKRDRRAKLKEFNDKRSAELNLAWK